MELNLLSRSVDSSISPGKRNIAIAEIVIYSLIHLAQFGTRYLQEQKYWHHNKNKGIGRCILYSWWSMVGLLSQSEYSDQTKYDLRLIPFSPHSWFSFDTCFFAPRQSNGHRGIRYAKRGPLASFV